MPREAGAVWKDTGWYVTPDSAREVMTMLGSIGSYSAGQRFAWRGMSSADFEVWSSLHRRLGRGATEDQLREAELETLRDARAWGLGVEATGHADDFHLLSDLQHYGVATRLIDFTSNPMTALWFACQEPRARGVAKSGVLIALNTTRWDTYSTVGNADGITWGTMAQPSRGRLAAALSGKSAFRVESAAPNERLRAQEGFFIASAVPPSSDWSFNFNGTVITIESSSPFVGLTVPYSRTDPLQLRDQLTKERRPGGPRSVPFVAVIIRANLKRKLLRYLEGTYNRTSRVLFPDYSGFLQFGQATKRELI